VAGYLVRFVDFTITAWLVVQQTDSSFAVGLLVFFRIIPFLVFGPFLGVLLDRFPKIAIYRLAQLGMAVASGAFALALANDFGSLPVIYAYTSIMGILLMLEIPSKRAYLSDVVGSRALGSALALDMVSMNVAWFAGANLGGLIVNMVDPVVAYGLIGLVFSTNYLVLRGLPIMFRPGISVAGSNAFLALADGFRYVRSNPAIFGGLLVLGVNNFFGYPFESMAPAFANDVYGAGPMQFGLLMSAQGLGALFTALYISLRGRRLRNPGKLLIGAALIQSMGSIGFSFTQSFEIGFVSIAALGLVSTVFAITHTMLILLVVPANYRGRIMGFQVLMMGLYPIGSLTLGFAADAIGLGQAVRLFAASGVFFLALIWVRYPALRKPLG
jgi:MFS family permease